MLLNIDQYLIAIINFDIRKAVVTTQSIDAVVNSVYWEYVLDIQMIYPQL